MKNENVAQAYKYYKLTQFYQISFNPFPPEVHFSPLPGIFRENQNFAIP